MICQKEHSSTVWQFQKAFVYVPYCTRISKGLLPMVLLFKEMSNIPLASCEKGRSRAARDKVAKELKPEEFCKRMPLEVFKGQTPKPGESKNERCTPVHIMFQYSQHSKHLLPMVFWSGFHLKSLPSPLFGASKLPKTYKQNRRPDLFPPPPAEEASSSPNGEMSLWYPLVT